MKTYITAGALAEAMGEVVGELHKDYVNDTDYLSSYSFKGDKSIYVEMDEPYLNSFIKAGLIKEVENG